MSDAVGLGINPPPNILDSLNGILGIQQKKQQLQIQGQELQQKQLQTEGMQGIQSYFSSVDPNAIHGEDGTVDVSRGLAQPQFNGLSGVQRVAVQSKLNELQAQGIEMKKGLQTLNANALTQAGQAALQASQSPQTAIDDLTRLASSNPELGRVLAPQIERWKQFQGKPDILAGAIGNFAKMTASIAEQQRKPIAYDTGPAIQTAAIDPFSGLPAAAGAKFIKGVAPQMVTPPGGIPTPYEPGKGVASPSKGSNAAGPAPTDQDLARHAAYESNLNSRVAVASDMLPRLKLLESAADSSRMGAGSETRASMAKALQAANAPKEIVDAVAGGNLGAVQEAEKLMFQTTFSGLKQSMQGDSTRVAEFNAAEKVFPTIGTDPRARHAILGFMSDQGQRDYAEQQALSHARSSGTFNPVTWQGEYQKTLREGKVPGVPESQVPKSNQGRKPVRTGDYNGKRVTQYDDGSIE